MEFPADDEPSERGGETPNGIHDPAAHRPNSSHERFKSKYPELTPRMISNWQKNGSLRRYAETSYWLHKDGAVLLRQSSGFVYAEPTREPTRLYVTRDGVSVHVMMMRAFVSTVTAWSSCTWTTIRKTMHFLIFKWVRTKKMASGTPCKSPFNTRTGRRWRRRTEAKARPLAA